MASRGKKKRSLTIQNNTLLRYLPRDPSETEKICLCLLTDLLTDVIINPDEVACSVLTEILNEVVKPKKHDAGRVSEKTKSEWEKKHPWLLIDVDRGMMKCKACSDMQSKLKLVNVWANEGSPNFQYSGITRHIASAEHKNAIIACEQEKQLQTISKETMTEIDDNVLVDEVDKKLFNTVYYAAKMEIPSNTINALLELQTKNGLNIKYTNLSWDSISEIQTSIEQVLLEGLVNDIKASPVFALMLDESTDVTIDKRLSICVRYIKAGEPVTNMLVNVHLEDGTAHTIVNCVAHEFERYGIDLANCSSLATDGAAVMLGKHKGVGKQLISKYSPFCIQIHCMAHRLNLACTDSIKKNDFMIKFREKFNSLYLFISGSSNRTLSLKKIQALLDEPEISIKEPYSIRWLGLKNAVSAVYESFGSVLATLSKFAAEKNAVAKGLLKYFSSYKVALAVAFILDVHNELAVLSCQLQKKNLLFSEIKPVMDATVYKLSSMQTTDGKCLTSMKSDIEISDDGVFFSGEKLSFHENMGVEFDTVRAEYIKRLKKNINDRFRKEDSDLYSDFSRLFEPQQFNTSSLEECNQAVESLSTFYGFEKSVKVIEGNLIEGTQETVRIVKPLVDPEKVQDELPRYQGMVKGAYVDMPTDKLCKRVILLHSDIIPNIAKLAAIALCLQPTSVECERTFSTQNRLKNKHRASLGNEKLNTLMTISMLGPHLSKFDATSSVIHWLRQKRRRKQRLCSTFKPRAAKKQKVCC